MKIVLMYSPLDDPTMPYHATAYLVAQLKARGVDAISRDINIEFVDYCLQGENVWAFYTEAERRLTQLKSLSELNLTQQEEYLLLSTAPRHTPDALREAVKHLRTAEAFTEYPQYLSSVRVINEYFGFLGCLSYPASIADFRQATGGSFSVYTLNDLLNFDLLDRTSYPFRCFFEQKLVNDPDLSNADCLGISIIYDYQLTYAVWFANALKRRWPEKMVVLGGTSISQFYKHLSDKTRMKRFFSVCDAIVVGEGETAICEIAECNGDVARLIGGTNTITYDRKRDIVHFPPKVHYEKVAELPPPVFSQPWHLYLSPHRAINYSPTRGCYWNRCTFCDYGLNDDKPTSPWRERKIEQVIADLQHVVATQGIEYVYFAVDVMAPGYLERLSDAIIASNLKIRWCAELRLEKIFSRERCEKLAKSGCVCVSFGMESGNQRILDLIDKGTKVQYMGETMKNFSEAGIAVQLMAFQGFPTESQSERDSTVDFVKQHREYWATGGLGTFLLTGSAIVAKNPEKFGVELIRIQGVDSTRALAYNATTADGKPHGSSELLTEEYDASFHDHGDLFPRVLGRPWAGGTDSLHSMIFYGRYGRKFFRNHPLAGDQPPSELPSDLSSVRVRLQGTLTKSPFSLTRMLESRRSSKSRKQALLRSHIEPTYPRLLDWQSSVGPLMRETDSAYWIFSGKRCMRLDTSSYDLLQEATTTGRSVGEILGRMSLNEQIRGREYLKRLANSSLVELFPRAEGPTSFSAAEVVSELTRI